nr:DNA repair protein RAD5B-like isoform X2 [Ziziphus jujuba var. spinosa]
MPESDILGALSKSHYDPDAAIKFILNNAKPITIMHTGARISTQIKQEVSDEPEERHLLHRSKSISPKSRMELRMAEFDEFVRATSVKVMSTEEYLDTQMKEELVRGSEKAESLCGLSEKIRVKEEKDIDIENDNEHRNKIGVSKSQAGPEDECLNAQVKQQESMVPVSVKAEPVSEYKPTVAVKEEHASGVEQKVSVKEETVSNQPWPFDDYKAMREKFMKNREQTGSKKPCDVKKERAEDRVFNSLPVEDGDFPEEPGWFLVGRTVVTALSTSRGRKLVDNEIVYFSYPTSIGIFNSIVRFSTKRVGEVHMLFLNC